MQNETIQKTIEELAKREREFVEAFEAYPVCKHNYKIKFAIAIEQSEGSVAAKEAAATKICSREYLEYLEAESRCEIVKTLIADCRAVLSTRQSLLSAEVKLHEATKYITA